jgi:hypothetical protein
MKKNIPLFFQKHHEEFLKTSNVFSKTSNVFLKTTVCFKAPLSTKQKILIMNQLYICEYK